MSWRRALVALGIPAMACSSPSPTATRSRHETSATPPAEAGPDVTAATVATSAGPAPTSSVGAASTPASTGPTTAYVITVPTDPPTTTTIRPAPIPATTNPEYSDEEMGDVEWLIRQTFPEAPDKAARVARCESRLNPGAINGQHIGVMQVATKVHAELIADMGYEPADLLDVRINLRVARAVYDGADGGPKGWAAWTCAA